jgi:hypothetical protein
LKDQRCRVNLHTNFHVTQCNITDDMDTGKILNLGADWRLTDSNGKFRPDARYHIQAKDGTFIYVQTEGPTLEDGRSLLRGKFETATNGTHSWLNDVVAVGLLNRSGSKVYIDMWSVS